MEPVDLEAAEALVKMVTLGRDANYETIKDLVVTVMKSDLIKFRLPILIVHIRNHNKSLGPGVAMEKSLCLCNLCAHCSNQIQRWALHF
jgi:hypothetical protein